MIAGVIRCSANDLLLVFIGRCHSVCRIYAPWLETAHIKRLLRVMSPVALLAFGCATIDEVRQESIRWTATYDVAFDTMAKCLAAGNVQSWAARSHIDPRDGLAYVTLSSKSTIIAEYVVRRQGDAGSLVEWRRLKLLADLGGFEASSRQAADRCGKPTIVEARIVAVTPSVATGDSK